jgi:hypothetical protein
LPARIGKDREYSQATQQKDDVKSRLLARLQQPVQRVRVQVADQKQQLEEQHATDPHGRRSAEPGQNELGRERLDQKEKTGAEQNRRAE